MVMERMSVKELKAMNIPKMATIEIEYDTHLFSYYSRNKPMVFKSLAYLVGIEDNESPRLTLLHHNCPSPMQQIHTPYELLVEDIISVKVLIPKYSPSSEGLLPEDKEIALSQAR